MRENLIEKYFTELNEHQKNQLYQLEDLYFEWNSKINVISRKDMDDFLERHVLHSLSIAKKFTFKPETSIMDLGTGGGFPGIPLAIFFPDTRFLLTDSIGKKIKVVNEIASSLNLKNVEAIHTRSEDVKEKFDFVITRAVAEFDLLYNWTKKKFNKENKNSFPNGLICLKGGDLHEELKNFSDKISIFPISDFYSESFFETKKIVYLPTS
ncbi:MAG: 16S rRNA (guanine(527)-N(7))-methyltransferase RsmG [Bacteroidota bacterium]